MAIRSEQSRQAILQSTMKLLDEREPGSMSVQQLSIERIAREAGVSKTTIYRWWPDKAAVIIDTFLENHILLTPMREDLPPIEALREHVVALAAVYAGHEGRLMAQLLAESQYDPATLEEFKAQFWRPRREVVNRMIERAIETGSYPWRPHARRDRRTHLRAHLLQAARSRKAPSTRTPCVPASIWRWRASRAVMSQRHVPASARTRSSEHDRVISVTNDAVLRMPLHGTREDLPLHIRALRL